MASSLSDRLESKDEPWLSASRMDLRSGTLCRVREVLGDEDAEPETVFSGGSAEKVTLGGLVRPASATQLVFFKIPDWVLVGDYQSKRNVVVVESNKIYYPHLIAILLLLRASKLAIVAEADDVNVRPRIVGVPVFGSEKDPGLSARE
jgi:hypothetical protein